MASETASARGTDHPRTLIGHLSEYQRLLTVLDAQPRLSVLAADPLSGASAIVRSALAELSTPSLFIDARGALDDLDLAMAIADAAVATLRPEASAWWAGTAPNVDREGLRLHRALSADGVDIEALRHGSGPGSRLLRVALETTTQLAGGPVVVCLDHLDNVVGRPQQSKADPLGTLRAAMQQLPELQLLLVGRTAGPIERAIHDHTHPLFQAGQVEALRRAEPSRFVDDLVIARSWTDAPIGVIRTAAELAAGVPAYTWAVVDLATQASGDSDVERALSAWRELRRLCETQTGRHFDLLRAVHPVAQPVLAATAAGLGAYTLPINDGRVRAALQRLRAVGAAWQPREREWAVADPLLSAWSRDHAPPWVARRARAATGGRFV